MLHQKESSLFSLRNCFVCRQESKNKSLAFWEEEVEEEGRLSRPSVSVLLLQVSETCRKKKQRDNRIADLVYASFFGGGGGAGRTEEETKFKSLGFFGGGLGGGGGGVPLKLWFWE